MILLRAIRVASYAEPMSTRSVCFVFNSQNALTHRIRLLMITFQPRLELVAYNCVLNAPTKASRHNKVYDVVRED